MSEDSKLLSIGDLIDEGTLSKAQLEKKCFDLSNTLVQINETLGQKMAEIAHLKKLLEGATGVALAITDEEEIASIQLEKLKAKSRAGELTLEEAKKYDLYVKNKRLAKGDPTTINADGLPKGLGKQDLIKIAKR
jgi:hypothetical protein